MSVYSWTTHEPVLKNCQCSTLALLLEPCSFLVQMARYAQLDKKQPVTWFWKTSRSFKAIVRCWPFPTCMTKDQFRRRRHNCRRVLKYYNVACSLISLSIVVSNKNKRTPCHRYFTLGALRQQRLFQTKLVERWCHGGKPAYSQDSVESCQVTDPLPFWAFASLSFGTFLKYAQRCWDLHLGLICLNQLGNHQIISSYSPSCSVK